MRNLESADKKPITYMSIPIIRDAVWVLDFAHNESDVERAIALIFGHIFPQTEGWSNVPQYLVPEIKRPVEKYTDSHGHKGPRESFCPHIFVELKSAKGDSLEKAVNQATSSMAQSVDNLGGSFAIYLVIVKGKDIAFFEYHNDRSNLYEDGVQNHKGAIPYNRVKYNALDIRRLTGRPDYTGSGSLNVDFEKGGLTNSIYARCIYTLGY
jgi:hypothetical protein